MADENHAKATVDQIQYEKELKRLNENMSRRVFTTFKNLSGKTTITPAMKLVELGNLDFNFVANNLASLSSTTIDAKELSEGMTVAAVIDLIVRKKLELVQKQSDLEQEFLASVESSEEVNDDDDGDEEYEDEEDDEDDLENYDFDDEDEDEEEDDEEGNVNESSEEVNYEEKEEPTEENTKPNT